MHPLVAVKSFGKEKASDIIKEIMKANGDLLSEPKTTSIHSYDLTTYESVLFTRYFTTKILLFECNDLNTIPDSLKPKVEGCIFYFDTNDEHFLTELNSLVEFVNDNNIEVALLITRNLIEDSSEKFYDELTKKCQLSFFIIDLNSKNDEDDKVLGYAEVLEVFKNNTWSTVKISSRNHKTLPKPHVDDENVEEALNEFEDLLARFQQFKDISPNLCREEVLTQAEGLAELFANLLNEN